MTEQPSALPLRSALRAVRQRLWVVLLCLVLVPSTALAVSLLQQKEYTTTASLLFRDPQLDQKLFGSTFVQSSTDPAREAATNVELVSLDEVALLTAKRLGRGLTAKEVSDAVKIEAQGQSDVVSVAATARDPQFAAELANLFAGEYVRFRREADRSKIRDAARLVEGRSRSLSARERKAGPGQSLRQRLDQLDVLTSLQTGNAEVVEPARAPSDPSSPLPLRNGALGLVLGALLGLGVALLLDRLDRRLRDPGEIEETFERPVLAALQESRALNSADATMTTVPESEREAFRMLRANLRYFSLSREIRSVLITSSGSGDGKSTVAWGLAQAAASTGSRTLLVESDLRHPSLGARYKLRSRHGLTSVLTGGIDRAGAINQIRLPTSPNDRGLNHSMDVLLAGPLPPNPTDLVGSQPMADLIHEAERDYDLVVVDTPPTAIVSDAIPLVTMVGGVIVVSRLGKTTRDALRHLRSQLENLDAPILGVVVNSVNRGTGYGYGYGYGTAGEASASGTQTSGRQRAPVGASPRGEG